jgi:hypothetical protein
MESTIFVRPNLKLLLLGGVLLLLLQHVSSTVLSQGSSGSFEVSARATATSEMHELLRRAANQPSSEVFMRLSVCFEKRGEFKNALIYLRRADKQRESEDFPE